MTLALRLQTGERDDFNLRRFNAHVGAIAKSPKLVIFFYQRLTCVDLAREKV